MFIFFACPKKTNQQRSGERKDSLTLAVSLLACGFPALLEPAGSLKTRFAQTGQTPFSADSPLLGCVKWHYMKRYKRFKVFLKKTFNLWPFTFILSVNISSTHTTHQA
jgi:hypothetical protein